MSTTKGRYYIVIVAGRDVYWTHGDRNYMYLIGEFDNQAAARQCALNWSERTGREILYR
jgi:hypothetical protein